MQHSIRGGAFFVDFDDERGPMSLPELRGALRLARDITTDVVLFRKLRLFYIHLHFGDQSHQYSEVIARLRSHLTNASEIN